MRPLFRHIYDDRVFFLSVTQKPLSARHKSNLQYIDSIIKKFARKIPWMIRLFIAGRKKRAQRHNIDPDIRRGRKCISSNWILNSSACRDERRGKCKQQRPPPRVVRRAEKEPRWWLRADANTRGSRSILLVVVLASRAPQQPPSRFPAPVRRHCRGKMVLFKPLVHLMGLLICLLVNIRADINRTGCNRTVDAGDVLANPLLTGFNKGKPYSCWFLVSLQKIIHIYSMSGVWGVEFVWLLKLLESNL